jgi:hypothetical protein
VTIGILETQAGTELGPVAYPMGGTIWPPPQWRDPSFGVSEDGPQGGGRRSGKESGGETVGEAVAWSRNDGAGGGECLSGRHRELLVPMAQVSTYPDEEIYQAIEAYADHHEIPLARAAELLIEEGLAARAERYQAARVEAKLDRLLEEFAVDVDEAEIDDQAAARMALGSPFGSVQATALGSRPAPPVVDWVQRGRDAVAPAEEGTEEQESASASETDDATGWAEGSGADSPRLE